MMNDGSYCWWFRIPKQSHGMYKQTLQITGSTTNLNQWGIFWLFSFVTSVCFQNSYFGRWFCVTPACKIEIRPPEHENITWNRKRMMSKRHFLFSRGPFSGSISIFRLDLLRPRIMGVRVIQPLQPRRSFLGGANLQTWDVVGWSYKISEMYETNGEMPEDFWHLSGFMTAIYEEQVWTCCLSGFWVH